MIKRKIKYQIDTLTGILVTKCPFDKQKKVGGCLCKVCPRFISVDRGKKEVTHNIGATPKKEFLRRKKGLLGVDYDIDERYWCKACGSHTHREYIDSALCYECGADNWEPEKGEVENLLIL